MIRRADQKFNFKMEEVPLKTIKCGKLSLTQPGCFLFCKYTTPGLQFVWRNVDCKDRHYLSFQCEDISAVDLRVATKFGSIDAMRGTIVVECLSPVLFQQVGDPEFHKSSDFDSKSFIIEATFHVNETGAVRDIIRQLRSTSRQTTRTNENENNECSSSAWKTKSTTFQEGLPDWVGFIPHVLYSRRLRQLIELTIFIYVVFSVTWALWQLYRHVDFVRESVTPLIDMLKCQYHLLDNTVHLFNTLFEEYTNKWLCFIKPLYTVTTILASPLWKIFAQLGPVFHVALQVLTAVWQVLGPVAKPIFSLGYQFVLFIFSMAHSVKTLMSRFLSPFYDTSLPVVVRAQFNSAKRILGIVYRGLGQTHHLDPLKVQLVLVRTTVIQSGKALGLGVVRLVKQIYKIFWLRRSAKATKED